MIPLVTRVADLERQVAELKERDRGGYLSMRDAAEYLGISYATVKNLVSLGRFSAVKMGSGQNARVLIARKEIHRYLNKHTVNGEPRADGSFHVDQSGNLTGSLTLSPPGAGDFKCPSGQSLTLSGVTYSQVRVVDLGPTSSGLVAEFDFKGTF